MLKPTTHFEQVPLKIIKRIIGEEIPPETVTKQGPKTRRKKWEKDGVGTKKKFAANFQRSLRMELPE